MAAKQTSFRQGGNNTHKWELFKSEKDNKEFTLVISEIQDIEKEVFSKEIREIPIETITEIAVTDGDGKEVKKEGKTLMEKLIKKSTKLEEVKVSSIVRATKFKVLKKFTFFFKPFGFQVNHTFNHFINSLDSE